MLLNLLGLSCWPFPCRHACWEQGNALISDIFSHASGYDVYWIRQKVRQVRARRSAVHWKAKHGHQSIHTWNMTNSTFGPTFGPPGATTVRLGHRTDYMPAISGLLARQAWTGNSRSEAWGSVKECQLFQSWSICLDINTCSTWNITALLLIIINFFQSALQKDLNFSAKSLAQSCPFCCHPHLLRMVRQLLCPEFTSYLWKSRKWAVYSVRHIG